MKAIKVILNQGQLKHITKQVRDEGGADYRFDVNLLEGKLSENKWAEMLETIEFKKDYKAWDTGNIAVEYSNNGKPSGISVTEAKYIAYVLVDEKQNENVAIFIKTEVFKKMCRKYLRHPQRDIKGGDNFSSSLILLPVKELLNPKFIFESEDDKKEWEYKCRDCGYVYISQSKTLFKICPDCIKVDKKIKLEII